MEARRPAAIALTIVAYVITTFAVQGASHFSVNAEHYATFSIMRSDPVIPMGVASMIIQGALFALLFPSFNAANLRRSTTRNAILFSWAIGAFLTSYVALGEAGKYVIPSIRTWIAVETSVAAVQYTLFGVLLGLVHRRAHGWAPVKQTA